MKKQEAVSLSIDRSRVIMEYISQILSDPEGKGKGTIELLSDRVKGKMEPMCVFVIKVPERNFLKPIDSGISSVHTQVFYTQILNDLIENYLDSDTINLKLFYSIRGMMGRNFDGLAITGMNGNQLKMNFHGINNREIIDWYNQKITEKENAQQESQKKK